MLRYGRSTVSQRCQTSLPSSVSPASRAVIPVVDTDGPANTFKSGIWKKRGDCRFDCNDCRSDTLELRHGLASIRESTYAGP